MALGDLQSMLEALPEEESATPTAMDSPASVSNSNGIASPDLLSPTAGAEGLADKKLKKSWFRGKGPTAAGLLSPRVRRLPAASGGGLCWPAQSRNMDAGYQLHVPAACSDCCWLPALHLGLQLRLGHALAAMRHAHLHRLAASLNKSDLLAAFLTA